MSRPAEPAQIRALMSAVEDADGVAAFSEQTILAVAREGSAPVRTQHERTLLSWEGEDLVAFGHLDPTGSAELAVHPRHRRRGHGAALLDRILQAAPQVRIWAHGPHPGAAPLARSRDLERVRELWLMTAPPPPGPVTEPVAPAGVDVATFTESDADDLLTVNARAFAQHPEQGALNRADLDARLAEPWFDAEGLWLARESTSGALLGFMWTKVSDGIGEIYVLGIDPAAQGRGLGRYLTALAVARFAGLDLSGLELYVEGENTAAIRTYQRAGYTRARADLQYRRR